MWLKFFGWLRFIFDLFEETQDVRAEQARLNAKIESLVEEQRKTERTLRDVAHGLVHLRDNDKHEREKLLLKLENELLKFERRLPPRDPQ